MLIARIACLLSFSLRKSSKEVYLSGKAKKATYGGKEKVEIEIPFPIISNWSEGPGVYGTAKITFNWVDHKPTYADLSETVPLIDIKTIDGWELSEDDVIALSAAGLNELVMAQAFLDIHEKDPSISDLPKNKLIDFF